MGINRSAIKADAKLAMGQAKPNVYLFTLLYLVIAYVLSILSLRMTGSDGSELMQAAMTGSQSDILTAMQSQTVSMGWARSALYIAIELMSMIIGVGYTLFCLHASRRISGSYGTLFDGFAIFFRILWLYILIWIFTFLWSLLLIIPGIIASYRYRQAVYILLEHPEYSALDCIRASKMMMSGRKGELFVLDLSFIGWQLLACIPFTSIWIAPYLNITYANFYNAVSALPSSGSSDNSTQERPPWEYDGGDSGNWR